MVTEYGSTCPAFQNVRETVVSRTADEVISLLLVALLWGGTNPFLKKGTRGIEQVQKSNPIIQLLAEIKFLFLNYNYLVPFFLNQCGSIIYYYTLATTELSLAVTMSNSLTFLFTLLTGKLLGEEIGGKRAVLGILMVALGITLCVGNSGNTEQSQHG